MGTILTLSGSANGQLRDPARALLASAVDIPQPHQILVHSHSRSQLLFAAKGVMRVTVGARTWSITPQHGIWAPSGVKHDVSSPGPVAYRSVYVDPRSADGLPAHPGPVEITPLLRELVLEAALFGDEYGRGTPEARLVAVLLDRLRQLRSAELPVPIPADPRLKRLCDTVLIDPGGDIAVSECEELCGASYRTIARLFLRETGLTFTAWRERVRLSFAIDLLRRGASVTMVALDLGYNSPSAFSAMFRRVMQVSPSEYLATRH